MIKPISVETSNKAALLSFICAVLVVCIHVQKPAGMDNWFVNWVSYGIGEVAVPFFFLSFGFFLLNGFDRPNWWINACKKRARTLLIPFFALNILWFPIICFLHALAVRYMHADASNEQMTFCLKSFLVAISPIPGFGAPCVMPLWFVRALMLIILLIPLLMPIVRKSKISAGLLLGGVFVSWIATERIFNAGAYEFSIRGLFYVLLGVVVRYWGLENIERRYGFALLISGVIGLILCKLGFVENCTISWSLWRLWPLLFILGSWSTAPSCHLPSLFVGSSFVIYVLHQMIIYLFRVFYKMTGAWDFANSTLGMIMSVALYVGLACLIGRIVKGSFPKLGLVLFGGR